MTTLLWSLASTLLLFATSPAPLTPAVTAVVDQSGGRLFLEGIGVAEVQAGFLRGPTKLTFSSSSERPTQYPTESPEFFERLSKGAVPAAPNVTLSVPSAAVSTDASNHSTLLQLRVPATAPFDDTGVAEIRYLFEDGTFELALAPYRYFDEADPSEVNDIVGVSVQSLLEVMKLHPGLDVRINVQPVKFIEPFEPF